MLGLTRSTGYYELALKTPEKKQLAEVIMARIDFWHTKMPYLGIRRMVTKLTEEGYAVGRKVVRRLMAEMGIHALYPKANLSKRNFKESIVPYLLRNKVVNFSNQVWSIDITYIKMQHLYRRQMAMLKSFLEHGAISPEQYRTSADGLTQKMHIQPKE